MTAKTTRILKEARPLFWPWCAMLAVGLLPLARARDFHMVSVWVFLFGAPLLAALPLGNEFQHRTLSLLLSQPADRMEMWGEKLSVAAIAVLSSVLVFSVSLWAGGFQRYQTDPVIGAWIIAAIASATFWTLITRSTLGSVAITIAVQGFIVMAGMLYRRALWGASPVLSVVTLLCYAIVMFWIGWRKLARFEVAGGVAGDDLLTAGPDVMPEALTTWLRCRPSGAVLNLFRKEIRLLRPVWLISLLAGVAWAGITVLSLHHGQGSNRNFQFLVVSLGVTCTLLIPILAGSSSLGEERSSGTHAWHLTLPVPALLQWGVKLSMALGAGVVGAWLLPTLITRRFLFMPSNLWVGGHVVLIVVLLLTVAAFWCASAVNGTVAAVLWVIPVTIALGCATYFATQLAREVVEFVFASRFNPFASFRFAWEAAMAARWSDYLQFELFRVLGWRMMFVTLVGGPALLLALLQSYRLFRTQPRDSARSVVRNLSLLVLLVFMCAFSLTASIFSMAYAQGDVYMLVGAASSAIQKFLPGDAKLDSAHPLQLTGNDAEKALQGWRFPVSENTRRWLRSSRITVTPDKAHPNGFYCVDTPWKSRECYYSAVIHLAGGTDVIDALEPTKRGTFPFARSSVYVRWPGAEPQELRWGR